MSAADRYRRLSSRFTNLINTVPADRWGSPSPCEGWTAHDVLDHVVTTEIEMLGRMPFAPAQTLDTTDTAAAWVAIRDLVQAALDDPDRTDHAYDGYFGPTTFGATIDTFYSGDLVAHTWDIARAVGLTGYETIDPAEFDKVRTDLVPMAPMMRQPGVFGPEIEVGDDADAQTRFLAFLGRRA